jgi:hypothetical protein
MPSVFNDDKSPLNQEYIYEILKSPESVLQTDASIADKILNVSKWLFDKSISFESNAKVKSMENHSLPFQNS